MNIKDYQYFEAKNERDSNMLNFVFKIVANEHGKPTIKFNKTHFINYCEDTSELYYEVCNGTVIRDTELEHVTKRFFNFHVKKFIGCLKKGIEYEVEKSDLSYIVDNFISINFGSFLTKEYIVEQLVEEFEDEDNLYQFKTLVPFITKSKNTEEPLLDYSDSDFREKIIFLYKLGIIDHLRKMQPFSMSVNKLAECLSAILGEDAKKIQRPLTDLVYDTEQVAKNNPLKNQSKVNKVEQKLIKIGIEKNSFFS